MSPKFMPKFRTASSFDWENKAVTVTTVFTSVEEAGRAVDFLKAQARGLWPDIMFRGDDDWEEEDGTGTD